MTARHAHAIAALFTMVIAGAAAGGCGSDSPQVQLVVSTQWNDDPSTVDQTGYQILVDIGWPTRFHDCFPLSPNLRVQVNDRQTAPMIEGDCRFDILVAVGPFLEDTPMTVRLLDGDRTIGEAQFMGLLPGAAARLASPADGRVTAGGDVVVSLPPSYVPPPFLIPSFYWMDMPASAPPFHTWATGSFAPDGTSVQITAPTLTGRAALIVTASTSSTYLPAQSCTGFLTCAGIPNGDTLGPVFVDVVP